MSRRVARLVVPVVLVTVAVAAAAWFVVRGRVPPAPPGNASDGPSRAELKTLRDSVLSQLENGAFEEALPRLREIAERFPDDPFGPRNEAVGIVWAVREQLGPYREPEKKAAGVAAGEDALQEVRRREGATAVMHRLVARLARAKGDEAAAVNALEHAIELAPNDPSLRWELYQTLKSAGSDVIRYKGYDELDKAAEMAPDNLAILVDRLQIHSERRSTSLQEVIARARETLGPFSDGIRLRTGVDVTKTLDEIAAAATAEPPKWPVVMRLVRVIGNVMRPEVALRIDVRRLEPHELEFALADFSESTWKSTTGPAPEPGPVNPVVFRLPDADSDVVPFAADDPIVDFTPCDFDLDGRVDVVALRGTSVAAYARAKESRAFGPLAQFALNGAYHLVVAADLDRDHLENSAGKPGATKIDAAKANDAKPGEAKPDASKPDVSKPDAADADDPALCLNSDPDLIVAGKDGVLMLRNRLDPPTGRRTLEAVAQDDAFAALRDVLAIAVADLDHDGDLDLVVSTQAGISLWANRDNFTFLDITGRSAVPPKEYRATGIIPVDWNRNVDIDLVLTSPDGPAGLLENNLHGRFRWRAFDADPARPDLGTRAAAVLDADGNASWDLVTAKARGLTRTLTDTVRSGVNQLRSAEALTETEPGGAAAFDRLATLDFDNDGVVDLLASSANRIELRRGLPNGSFESATTPFPRDVTDDFGSDGAFLGARVADIDGDGDEDILLARTRGAESGVVWLDNDGGNRNAWLDITLSAEPVAQRPSERTNMHGIGSLLELRTAGRYQPRTVAAQSTHFGLGKDGKAERVRILWTNGIPHNLIEPPANKPICAPQHLAGSCPYLYTWTGERYEFFSDCLWASPIGLQFAEGVLAPAREWEYLRVPGSALKEVDGEYRLQVTEELWEAAYFDTIQLKAVDHPADVAIYSNEKVGPPDLAAFKIHTVKNRRTPASVTDQKGRDLAPLVRAEDGRFARPFDRRIKQGLAEPHFLEIDLGAATTERPADQPPAKNAGPRVTLFLTGWIFPTCTSLNVGMSQNPDIQPPQPPSIAIPDGAGGWKTVLPFVGFPGGKTKTIAVELPAACFENGNTQIRLQTSMELAWDEIFFTIDEPPAEVRSVALELKSAELHFRGFSKRIHRAGAGPESYDYARVSTEPLWPPMGGRFTRFGDVTDLVRDADDRQVVLGAGDEMTLRFAAPDRPLPEGWVRDFLLYNVGWDKDADLNTVYGQTVEPLPFRQMKRYPYGADQEFPASDKHEVWLREWQTRTQKETVFWRQLLR